MALQDEPQAHDAPRRRRAFQFPWALLRGLASPRLLALCLTMAPLPLWPVASAGEHSLPSPVKAALQEHGLPPEALSVFVQGVGDLRPLLTFQAQQPRNPASVIKVLTTLVGLETLGPAYTWRTEAYLDGELHNGRLDGDLVLKGYGDPFLVTERFWKFLHGMRSRGLREIRGDLIIDNSFFRTPLVDPGEFDGKPHRVYNAQPDALMLNFQATNFHFLADSDAQAVHIFFEPPLSNLKVDNRMRLVPGPCRAGYYRPKTRIVTNHEGGIVQFEGNYAATCKEAIFHRLVSGPAPQVFGAFQALWTEMGGTLEGSLKTGTVPNGSEAFHTISSPSMADLIRGMNKFSNNVMTRQLLLTLGAEIYGEPGTLRSGRSVIHDWLNDNKVDRTDLIVDNGSGLSRLTRINAAQLGQVLLLGYRSPYMPEFVSSLPLAAIDGTMRKRLKGHGLEGRAHMKTGSLDGVSAIAGYLLNAENERLVVVVLINHRNLDGWKAKEVQDAVLRWAYETG